MKSIIPKALRNGDTIGVISPSSHCVSPDKITQAIAYLERNGYQVKLSEHLNCIDVDPAVADQHKLHDLHSMFADPTVHAIVCLRGGAGASRLLKNIDYDLIAAHPKILIGYSDVTALSLALYAKTGLVTFSGPMLATELYEPTPYTEEHFWGMITSPTYARSLHNYPEHELRCFQSGLVQGRLIGGNLSVLTSLIGTPWLPSLHEALLFFEDVNEPAYRIDRMLAHIDNAGLLHRLHGMLVGQLAKDEGHVSKSEAMRLQYVLAYYTNCVGRKAAVMQGLSYGHIRHLMTLPIGAVCRLSVTEHGEMQFGAVEAVIA